MKQITEWMILNKI